MQESCIQKRQGFMINNQNRYRVSTKFTLLKVGLLIVLLSIIINFVREIRSDTFNQKALIGLTLGAIALTEIFYFISTC